MTGKVVFHLPKQFLESYLVRPHLLIFQRIQHEIESRGGKVEVRRRHESLRDDARGDWSDILECDKLHIIENGTVVQENAFNAALAYLPPYFHLHQQGVLARSPAQAARFDPQETNPVLAAAFATSLRHRLVGNRRSRYGPKKEFTEISDGCIAVFLQGDNPHQQGTANCDTETLLRAVAAGAAGRKIVVKAHPISRQLQDARVIHQLLQEGVQIVPTDANVHDILARCAATVSFNSAVSIEGFLHNKPAILFGRSDFHHVAETVTLPSNFPDALGRALTNKREYSTFLYWYFSTFCLSVDRWNIGTKVLAQFESHGFGSDFLGLSPATDTRAEAAEKRKKAALKETTSLLRVSKGFEQASLRSCEVNAHEFQRFLGRVDKTKITVVRFRSETGADSVQATVSRIKRLKKTLQAGAFTPPECLLAWPEVGLLVVRHVPGKTLFEKIKRSESARRGTFVQLGADWLKESSHGWRQLKTLRPVEKVAELSSQHKLLKDSPDQKIAEAVLTKMAVWAEQNAGVEISHALCPPNFGPADLRFQNGTVGSDTFCQERWTPIAQASASFLTYQTLHDSVQPKARIYGICSEDWSAFLSTDVLEADEACAVLPFFVGLQILQSLLKQSHGVEHSRNLQAAALGFVEDF